MKFLFLISFRWRIAVDSGMFSLFSEGYNTPDSENLMKSFRLALAAFFLVSLGVISIAVTQEGSLVQVGHYAKGQ